MQYSGILVVARPGQVDGVAARLESLPGVEVYARHAASGRIVVVQEAADADAHESRFREIQALPGVVATELVYHLVDAGETAGPAGA